MEDPAQGHVHCEPFIKLIIIYCAVQTDLDRFLAKPVRFTMCQVVLTGCGQRFRVRTSQKVPTWFVYMPPFLLKILDLLLYSV